MQDVILPDGSVYRFDGDSQTWRHIPDVDTANAMGVDWNNLAEDDSLPGPQGPDWPSVDQPSAPPPPPPAESGPPPPPSSQGGDEIDPSGNVYRFDPALEQWRHIPDVATANAMGVDWNNLQSVGGPPQPQGPDWPEVAAPTPSAPPPPPDDGSGNYTFILPLPGNADGFTLPGTYGGELTASGAWDSFAQVLTSDAPNAITDLSATADRLQAAAS